MIDVYFRLPICALVLSAILVGCNREPDEKPKPTAEPAGATGGHYMAVPTGQGVAMPVVPPAPKPTQPLPKGTSCVTSKCHAIMSRSPQIHGPVAAGSCDACHDGDTGQHHYPLKRDTAGTCTFCHAVSGTQKHQHKALEQGCTICHDPHASRAKFLLKAETVERTCTACHNMPMKRFAHEPFLKGQCTLCHKPHEADNKKLLRGGEGSKHCLSCHDNLRLGMSQSSHVHEPAATDCAICHEPHTSENPRELRQPLVKTCASCHKKIEQKAAAAAVPHGAMTQGKECANCHNVHASNQGALLHDRMDKVCLTCHDRQVKGKNGRTIAGMKSALTESKFLHGPIRAGSCSGCHDPHGAGHADLLERAFPASFYTRFEVGKYALCFSCHQADMVLTAKTTSLTGFRDGDRNMHFLHVNRDDKGRSCQTCHAIHGSNLPQHIAGEVPFRELRLDNADRIREEGRWRPMCAWLPCAKNLFARIQGGDCADYFACNIADDQRCSMKLGLLICSTIFLMPMNMVLAAGPSTRPSAMVEWKSCVTAECHVNVKKQKILHGPVNVDACDACHKVDDARQHTFSLIRGKTETCTFCHKVETVDKAVVHKPVAQGECLQCHDPHGGTTSKFIRGSSMSQMCAKCHTDVLADKKVLHGPAAAGACGSCHKAHASDFPKLLAAQGRDMCLSCHTDMKNELKTAKFTHKAVEQDCMKCHDPHASNFPKVTKQTPLELCTSCHEHDKIKQAATDAKFKHTIVTANDACLNCHTAHGGSLAKLMKSDPINVCMKCHAEPIKVDKTTTVAAVAEVLDAKMIKHGPIREGNCGGCHNVHGSDVAKLLAKPYPEKFYQGFSLDKYELCFTCHDKQLVLNEKARGLTGFRNGDANLHFVHVNKSDKGRNCRACHSTHASSHEQHIRDSVPYGNWQMPINFAKTSDGGSCSPGCHKEFSYNRVKPADYSKPMVLPATATPSTTPSTKESRP